MRKILLMNFSAIHTLDDFPEPLQFFERSLEHWRNLCVFAANAVESS